MKIYNLNIDTSAPVNQAVPMQQNDTGLLNLTVTNGGKYIRNLTTKVYDDAVEVPSTEKGFKVDVGAEPKHVKIEAKSTPTESQYTYVANIGTGTRFKNVWLDIVHIPAGTYRQDEFASLKRFGSNSGMQIIYYPKVAGNANFDRMQIILQNPNQQLFFGKTQADNSVRWFSSDEPLIVTEETEFGTNTQVRTTGYVLSTDTYPAIGYYTDYQMDITIKPSTNAHYDGDYVEPLEEIEVNGVKFVPTTLSVDGVAYKVLAEAQSDEDPVDSTDTELTDGQE